MGNSKPIAWAWLSDGDRIVASWDGKPFVHQFDTESVSAKPLPVEGKVLHVESVPRSPLVALSTRSGGKSLILCDLDSGAVTAESNQEASIQEFSQDGAVMSYVLALGCPKVVRFENDSSAFLFLQSPPSLEILPRIWSPRGEWMAMGRCAWKTGEPNLTLAQHKLEAEVFIWSPVSDEFLSIVASKQIWRPGPKIPHCALSYPYRFLDADWSPDGSMIAFVGNDTPKICIFNVSDGKMLHEWQPRREGAVPNTYCASWSPDGQYISAGDKLGVYVLRASDGVVVAKAESDQPWPQGRLPIAWTPDGERFLVFTPQQVAVVGFDGLACRLERTILLNRPKNVFRFLGPNVALCATEGGEIHRIDIATGKTQLLPRESGTVVDISPDGDRIAAIEHEVHRIRGKDGGLIASLSRHHPSGKIYIVSPDGHIWSPDYPGGPKWARPLQSEMLYVVDMATGRQTLTPAEFGERYGWRNDPDQVQLRLPDPASTTASAKP